MIKRSDEEQSILRLLRQFPIVGLIGARQVGKTTLAHAIAKRYRTPATVFDLEDPRDIGRLSDPMFALQDLTGLVVIDEVQRFEALFPVLRVLADRPKLPARFLLLGSASPELIRRSSESLAGRISYHELSGFSVKEVGFREGDRLWLRGGFPRSYLASTNVGSVTWRKSFIRTFMERDLPQLGIGIRGTTMHRFWSMLAHYHAQVWNSSEFARAFGVADTTVRNYLDTLTSAMVVRQLLPWQENIGKRQVKSPRVYIKDSGLLHTLLALERRRDLEHHPKVGASWEGFVIEQMIRCLGARPEECFYWRTHAGAELDLVIVRGNEKVGIEVKRTSSPSLTPSMSIALKDLKLQHLYVIFSGKESFRLAPRITAMPFEKASRQLKLR